MAREFAGVLGFLAFSTVIVRTLLSGGGFDETIKLALIMMFAFAAVGYLAGSIAQQTIRESVMTVLDRELNSMQSDSNVETEATESVS